MLQRPFHFVLLAALLATTASAAEIRLKPATVIDAPIVRLGDLAEVTAPFASDAEALASIELFPAPIPASSRYVRSREIIDLLVRRGVDFSVHRISGAEATKISRPKQAANAIEGPQAVASLRVADRKQAEERLKAALIDYYRQHATTSLAAEQLDGLDVQFDAEDDLLTAVLAASEVRISVSSEAGLIGKQAVQVEAGTASFGLEVEPVVPSSVVIAARPLQRGAVVRAVDLQLEYQPNHRVSKAAYQSIESLVGKQITTNVGAGRAIAKNQVREPIVVNRGDVVTVMVNVGGVEVRTGGKANDDASAGQVVEVEALDDRDRTFFARATERLDPQTGLPIVEVYGGATTAE